MHSLGRVERIWGPGDGTRSVAELKELMDTLLLEYLVGFDTKEAERCVTLLNCKPFHHELVKRTLVVAMDKPAQQQQQLFSLLKHLHTVEVLSSENAAQGLAKFHANIDDYVLDAPSAPQVLDSFVSQSRDEGMLPELFTLE